MLSLLLVDDEVSVVETLAITIPWQEMGIETVYKAFNGNEALYILKNHNVDIVITDIHMPGISGLEFVQYINKNWSKTKCILLSGYADFQYAQEAIQHQVAEYLVKPISNGKLIKAVQKVIQTIREEWEVVASYRKAIHTLKENLPMLRSNLLNDVIHGRRFHPQTLKEKLGLLELPFSFNDSFSIVLVRIDDGFSSYDQLSSSLLDFSITNIFEEIFSEQFDICYTRDVHEPKPKGQGEESADDNGGEEAERQMLTNAAVLLQDNVKSYLKGRISVVISRQGSFPGDAPMLYQSVIAEIRKRAGRDAELFIAVDEQADASRVQSLQRLYEPPFLMNLLEAGLWDSAEQKINEIFVELNKKSADSAEFLNEVYYSIAGAFTYIAHKNGTLLQDIAGDYASFGSGPAFHSAKQLRDWTKAVLNRIKDSTDMEMKTSRNAIVNQVRSYIEDHLAGDVSLKTVSQHVFLHPNYLSKIYKLETGEALSEYIARIRMEKSVHMLRNHAYKVYEIAAKLGYQSAHYYIRVFKKHYGVTPQEYREKITGESFVE
jgi:two-component system response regulator YesN